MEEESRELVRLINEAEELFVVRFENAGHIRTRQFILHFNPSAPGLFAIFDGGVDRLAESHMNVRANAVYLLDKLWEECERIESGLSGSIVTAEDFVNRRRKQLDEASEWAENNT